MYNWQFFKETILVNYKLVKKCMQYTILWDLNIYYIFSIKWEYDMV